MKKKIVIGALLVSLMLVAAVVPVAAKANKVQFTGVGEAGPLLNPGVCTFPGGNEHCRGMMLQSFNDMTDDRLDGVETLIINFNLRPAPPPAGVVGPWWGTSQIENHDGYWTTSFTGGRDDQGIGHFRAVAHGYGAYEGLKAFFTGSRVSPDPTSDFIISGYILEPANH
jgi:hypothetical protein